MSGIEEAALAEAIAAIAAEEATTVAAYGGADAALGAGAGAAAGYGAADAAAAYGAGGAAEAGSGLTAADYAALQGGGYGAGAYGAGDTVTNGLLGSENYSMGYGAGNTVNDSLVNTETQNMLGNLKNEAANAYNKVGGAVNKLPKPVQGLVMSSLLGQQAQPSGPATARPNAMPGPQAQATPSTPAYSQQAPQNQTSLLGTFGSSYGPKSSGGLLGGMSPEEIEMLKRRRRGY